jgi:hypothetical protein
MLIVMPRAEVGHHFAFLVAEGAAFAPDGQ